MRWIYGRDQPTDRRYLKFSKLKIIFFLLWLLFARINVSSLDFSNHALRCWPLHNSLKEGECFYFFVDYRRGERARKMLNAFVVVLGSRSTLYGSFDNVSLLWHNNDDQQTGDETTFEPCKQRRRQTTTLGVVSYICDRERASRVKERAKSMGKTTLKMSSPPPTLSSSSLLLREQTTFKVNWVKALSSTWVSVEFLGSRSDPFRVATALYARIVEFALSDAERGRLRGAAKLQDMLYQWFMLLDECVQFLLAKAFNRHKLI